MAMMISKFHKLVQSKAIWGAFAVLISAAFVFAYNGARSDMSNGPRKKQYAGKLYGEEVSRSELARAVNDIRLLALMMRGQLPTETAETSALLEQNAWTRIAILKKAKQMGVDITEAQVAARIRQIPYFMDQQTGQFNETQYHQFFELYLPRMGMRLSETEFDQFIRNELIMSQLRSMVAQGALVTEKEIKDLYHLVNDQLVADYIELPRTLAPEPEVSREDAEKYFNENIEDFSYPERRKIQFVAFPMAAYTNEVSITDELVGQFYEAYKARYAEPLPEDAAEGAEPIYKPLEEVKDSIVEDLAKMKAAEMATLDARRFFKLMGTSGLSLEALAEQEGLEVQTSKPFSSEEALRGVDESDYLAHLLAQAAFTLKSRAQSPYHCYSDALTAENAVYMMECIEITPSFLPNSFESVEAKVMKAVQEDAALKAYADKADEVIASIKDALTAGKTFTEAASEYGLEIKTVGPFSRKEMPEGEMDLRIAQGTGMLEEGSLSKLIPGKENLAIAYVKEKRLADLAAASAEDLKTMKETLRSDKAQRLFIAWQTDVMKEAHLEKTSKSGE